MKAICKETLTVFGILFIFLIIGLMIVALIGPPKTKDSEKIESFDTASRRVVIINTDTNKPVIELIGNLCISSNDSELEITYKVGQDIYKKYIVYLNDQTIYTIEDVSDTYTDSYYYEINYLPETISPIVVMIEG